MIQEPTFDRMIVVYRYVYLFIFWLISTILPRILPLIKFGTRDFFCSIVILKFTLMFYFGGQIYFTREDICLGFPISIV